MDGAPLATLSLGALVFAAGAARLGRPIASVWRVVAFALGWCAAAAALLSPLDRLAASTFWAHMVQHQLLMVAAAPLLAVARPLTISLGALPRGARHSLARWRRAVGLHRWSSRLARPSIATAAFGVTLWAWHVPALYQAALGREVVHALEHASFLGAGVLFWWTLLGRRLDAGLATICLFATSAHAGLLGVLLTLARAPWYPAQSPGTWGLTPLEDQQAAGLVMWVPSGLAFVVGGLVLVASWIRDAERRVSVSTSDTLLRAARSGPRSSAARSGPMARGLGLLLSLAVILGSSGCTGHDRTAAELTGGDPRRGRQVVRAYGCQTCHTIPGVTGARGVVAPSLAKMADRALVAGHLPNTPDQLIRWIRHPQEPNRPSAMPDLGVTENDARDIAAYLYTLR
jgi:cytochrome c oxidase assembly factor CtaG/cytochrome c2